MPFSIFSKSLKLCTVFSSASASISTLLLASNAAPPPPTGCRHIGEAAFPIFIGNRFPCLHWSPLWGSYGLDWERGRTRGSSSSRSRSSSRDSCFQCGSGCFVAQGPCSGLCRLGCSCSCSCCCRCSCCWGSWFPRLRLRNSGCGCRWSS